MLGWSAARRVPAWLGAWALAFGGAACVQTVAFEHAGDGGTGPDSGQGFCPGNSPIGFNPELPIMMIALDRSTSMNDPFGNSGSESKLDAARQALVTMVQTYQSAVQFGYVGFPGTAGSCFPSSECCSMITASVPGMGSGGAQVFERKIYACDSPQAMCADGPERPTAAALSGIRVALAPYQQVRYYVLLVTDGDPGCAGPSNDACHDAEQALSMLGNNVTTNIVGLGPPAQGTDACLDELALYGNGGAYYPTRASDVNTTLQMVIRDAAQNTCRLDLYMQPSDPSNVRLYQDGVVIPHDQWDFQQGPSPKIELHGSACDTVVLQGTNGLEVVDCAPHH